MFLVNRSQMEDATITIDVAALGPVGIVEVQTLSDTDVYAANTLEARDRVGLATNASALCANGVVTLTLPPVSWTALELRAE